MQNLLEPTQPCSDLKCKDNCQLDELIPQIIQGIHSSAHAEIIDIDIIYPVNLKKSAESAFWSH